MLEEAMKAQMGVDLELYSFFNLGTSWGELSKPSPNRYMPGKETQYPLIIMLVGSQDRSGRVQNISSHQDSIPGLSSPQEVEFIITVLVLKYRVIHKSLRDFRTRLRNNQDIHGRKEHINR